MDIESLRRFVPKGMKLSEPTDTQIKREELNLKTHKAAPKEFREPEIFSEPLALEIHISSTRCNCCQAVFTSPDGAFMEVALKRLCGVYYKEVGHVLIPLAAQRPLSLQAVPHRIRTTERVVSICPLCMDHVESYSDPKVRPHEDDHNDPPLTERWFKQQREINGDGMKLRELINNIEFREAALSGEGVQAIQRERIPDVRALFMNVGIVTSQKVDPEEQWES